MSLQSAAELYVHALAIEREAAERYAELAARMSEQGNSAVAALFRMLANAEALHLEALKRKTARLELPALESDYSWLHAGPPESVARDMVFRLMTQRQALMLALEAEKRAHAFFAHAGRIATDPDMRALAAEMAAEEAEHVELIERMLARTPARGIESASFSD